MNPRRPCRPAARRRFSSCAASSLLALVAALAALPAIAAPGVYKWREADGRIVYSDLPPRPGVRATLLATPAGKPATAPEAVGAAAAEAVAGAAPGPVTGPAASPRPTSSPDWVEQAKLARQKRIERVEAEQARAEAERETEARAKRCEDIRTSLRMLDSGMRLSTVTERGQQIVMAVEERTRRAAELRRALAEDCQD
jgi:hypothetical protein